MNLAVFPGQGSQHVGMGKDLYDNFKIVQETFEEASDATGLHLKKLCFEGSESDLQLTENTQPALVTVSVAAFRAVRKELEFMPTLVAGHSLGEYSALVANECIPFSSAVKWVRERGIAMQKAVPAGEGAMLALMGFEDDLLDVFCKAAVESAMSERAKGFEGAGAKVDCTLSAANFNAPGQTVVSGSQDAAYHALNLIKTDERFSGKKAIPLAVSAPFHCSLMQPARDRMMQLFSKAQDYEKPLPLKFPYIPNVTARTIFEHSVALDLLIEQIDNPVRWKQSIAHAIESGIHRIVEFGPGKVLQGLCKRIAQPMNANVQLLGVNDVASLQALTKGLSS